jgi:hypothetical protein
MKKLVLSFLTLALLAGVASADHRWRNGRDGGRWDRGGHGYRNRAWNNTRVNVTVERPVYRPRPVYYQRTRVVRRPIYVQRPVVQYRYYNYYQRPAVIAENYSSMEGYYWVAGAWSWNGYEWQWTAGHYEPDPNYNTYYDGY